MAYRSFIDEQGTFWEVWEVQPQRAERRRTGSDRRRSLTPGGSSSAAVARERDDDHWGDDPPVLDRRMGRDRRRTASTGAAAAARALLGGPMASGWLAFESEGERRRLCPIPPDWSAATTGELAALCRTAQSRPTRPPQG